MRPFGRTGLYERPGGFEAATFLHFREECSTYELLVLPKHGPPLWRLCSAVLDLLLVVHVGRVDVASPRDPLVRGVPLDPEPPVGTQIAGVPVGIRPAHHLGLGVVVYPGLDGSPVAGAWEVLDWDLAAVLVHQPRPSPAGGLRRLGGRLQRAVHGGHARCERAGIGIGRVVRRWWDVVAVLDLGLLLDVAGVDPANLAAPLDYEPPLRDVVTRVGRVNIGPAVHLDRRVVGQPGHNLAGPRAGPVCARSPSAVDLDGAGVLVVDIRRLRHCRLRESRAGEDHGGEGDQRNCTDHSRPLVPPGFQETTPSRV